MIESEWKVYCPSGHASYERIRGVMTADLEDGTVSFSDCPKCGAPRRGEQLRPPR